jgi:hypothetical protein
MYSTHICRHTRYTKAQIWAVGFRLKKICPAEKIDSSCLIADPSCCCPARILSRNFGECDSCHAPASMSILDELEEAPLSSNLETACIRLDNVSLLTCNYTWVNLLLGLSQNLCKKLYTVSGHMQTSILINRAAFSEDRDST